MWLELITIFGIGYGDGYPASVPGRIADTFGCMASVFSVAIIIKIMFARLKLSAKEASAYHTLHQDV